MGRPKGSQNCSVDLKMKIVLAHEQDNEGYRKLAKRFLMPENTVKNILKVSE